LENRSFFPHFCSFALLLFLKERKSNHPFVVLFKRATKRAIAYLLFFKEQMSERLLNRSFEKSDEKSNCSFALL